MQKSIHDGGLKMLKNMLVIDFDDFNEPYWNADVYDVFSRLIEKYDKFKANVFVSPGISIPDNPWPEHVAYCLHGWNHTHFENLNDEQLDSWKFDKFYRAPYWELPNDLHARLLKHGYTPLILPDDDRIGLKYTWDIRYPYNNTEFGHGHISYSANGILQCQDNLFALSKYTNFKFLRDL